MSIISMPTFAQHGVKKSIFGVNFVFSLMSELLYFLSPLFLYHWRHQTKYISNRSQLENIKNTSENRKKLLQSDKIMAEQWLIK